MPADMRRNWASAAGGSLIKLCLFFGACELTYRAFDGWGMAARLGNVG
jgi:hypothetical protein